MMLALVYKWIMLGLFAVLMTLLAFADNGK